MNQIKLLTTSIFIFFLISEGFSQVVYNETFATPDRGVWLDASSSVIYNIDGMDWVLDYSKCVFVDQTDYAKTVTTSGGRFEVLSSYGEVVWATKEFDISALSSVSISLQSSEVGSNTGLDKKYVKASYKLNGASEVPFATNGVCAGNFGDLIAEQKGILGNKLQIVVRMNSSYSSDKVILDNVKIESSSITPTVPTHIKFIETHSTIASNEVFTVTAGTFTSSNELYLNSEYPLSLNAPGFEIQSNTYQNGFYSWTLKAMNEGEFTIAVSDNSSKLIGTTTSISIVDISKYIVYENFETENKYNWKLNNSWTISTETPISGSKSLKHNINEISAQSTATLSDTSFMLSDGNYALSFCLKNGNWDPSSSNNFYVMLSNRISEASAPNGYAIGVNALGSSDMVSIWHVTNGVVDTLVLQSEFDWNENTSAEIAITRSSIGLWSLSITPQVGSKIEASNGTSTSVTFINEISAIFNYTSTRSGQLWFDNLKVSRENTPPFILSSKVNSQGQIEVLFSENINLTNLSLQNFSLKSINGKSYSLTALQKKTAQLIVLTPSTIDEVDLELTASSIVDAEGAKSEQLVSAFQYIVPVAVHDVVINEIMADPFPVVALPNVEYIELKNRSSKNIQLKDWTLTVGATSKKLPEKLLLPGAYLVVCPIDSVSKFGAATPILGISSFPTLRNGGDKIILSDDKKAVIDNVLYSDRQYQIDSKKNGGWSLERIDETRFCGDFGNWIASKDTMGGTPGSANSVASSNRDIVPPTLLSASVVTSQSIDLLFSEPLSLSSFDSKLNFKIDGDLLLVDSLIYTEGNPLVTIKFNKALDVNHEYTLQIASIADECGNETKNCTAPFAMVVLSADDVKINEVLFNPYTNGSDFVEIYNTTAFTINMSKLMLATRNDTLALTQIYGASTTNMSFPPKSYMVLSPNIENIKANYVTQCPLCFSEMQSFPTLPDNSGRVVLIDDSLTVLDEFVYDESMHSQIFSLRDGVSLERKSIGNPTNDPKNWYSASSLVGYATPGYENSQVGLTDIIESSVTLEPDEISPNGDGNNDELHIIFSLNQSGYIANVSVFDALGRKQRQLTNNDLIGQQCEIIFDGKKQNGTQLSIGIYIAIIELIHPDGTMKTFKKSFLVTDKFSK